jgi:hypothetical protein
MAMTQAAAAIGKIPTISPQVGHGTVDRRAKRGGRSAAEIGALASQLKILRRQLAR